MFTEVERISNVADGLPAAVRSRCPGPVWWHHGWQDQLAGFAVRQDGVVFTQACEYVKQERRLHPFLPLPSTKSLPLVGAMASDPVPSAPCSPRS